MTLYVLLLSFLIQAPQTDEFDEALSGFIRTTEVHPDSALIYAQQMLTAAHNNEDDLKIVRAEYALGYTYRYLDNHVEAIRHYRISFQLARSAGFVERELMASNGLGMAFYQAGDYPESLRYLFLSLEQRRKRGISSELSTIYNNLGLVYLKLYNWEKAYEFFVQALMEHDQMTVLDGPILVNLGLCLTQLGRFEEATVRFSDFRQLCDESTECSYDLWCDFYNALGGMYHNQEQLESAEIYFVKAYEMASENGLDAQKEKALDNLATLAREQGSFERATILSDSALQISLRLGLNARIQNNFHQLAIINQEGGDLINSVKYWTRYDSMNQEALSMLNEIYTVAMNEQEQAFDARILDQNVVIRDARRNTYILSGLLLILLVISLLWWRNIQKKKRAIQELSDMREAFIRRQKLAALGTLMAGIAHEIHTPLGAARASLESTEQLLPTIFENESSNGNDSSLISKLYFQKGRNTRVLLGRERRQKRVRLANQLESYGVSNVRKWSEMLTDIGVLNLDKNILSVLEHNDGEQALEHVHRIVQVERSNQQARESVEQIQKVIGTFRDQALDQPTNSFDQVNIEESLRGALLLVKNQLKHGVDLEVSFPKSVLHVKGNPAQLSQVWTNILVNALQALTYAEKRISIHVSNVIPQLVHISFSDTGHGIGTSDQSHIFQNFYSTRHDQKGMGLGLHLARRIVNDHGGKITFVSGGRFTEMHVFLPKA